MKFSDIKDENGSQLQTFVELIQQKAKDAGLISVMVFVGKEPPNQGIHVISSMDGSPAHALIEVGRAMLKSAPDEVVLTPVSPGKAN